tara:strand:- start:2846 stop:3049 length:204 start_codon:yes stop_codon:yes gene_type:complete
MVDIISITALVIAILAGLSKFVSDAHLKKCHMCCIDSECRKGNNEPDTPKTSKPKQSLDEPITETFI